MSAFPEGPTPKNNDRAAIVAMKLLELFKAAVDSNGFLRITGSAINFKDLGDTPPSYIGKAGAYVRVKSDLSGLEFVDPEDSGVAWGDITGDINNQADLANMLLNYVLASQIGIANGIATLGSDAKLTSSQIPAGLLGAMRFRGTWNATTNTTNPDEGALVNGDPAEMGHYWQVNVAGTTNIGGYTDWQVGDWVVSLGATWTKIDNTDAVISVAGKIGAVTLALADLTNILITTPLDGQSLTYHAASGKWINSTPAAGGGGADLQEVWMNTGL
jgi:hypothetical protein